jgi:predicted nucleotidyltransferase
MTSIPLGWPRNGLHPFRNQFLGLDDFGPIGMGAGNELMAPRFHERGYKFARLPFASALWYNHAMKMLDDALLQTATQRLVTEFQPEQIWLYGSHAWGHPHDDSDVDLLVVVPHSDETPIHRSQRAHRCLRGLRMPKDVLVETRQEVDRVKGLKTSLENSILSRGRRLYG